jgi:hypothetical protein
VDYSAQAVAILAYEGLLGHFGDDEHLDPPSGSLWHRGAYVGERDVRFTIHRCGHRPAAAICGMWPSGLARTTNWADNCAVDAALLSMTINCFADASQVHRPPFYRFLGGVVGPALHRSQANSGLEPVSLGHAGKLQQNPGQIKNMTRELGPAGGPLVTGRR